MIVIKWKGLRVRSKNVSFDVSSFYIGEFNYHLCKVFILIPSSSHPMIAIWIVHWRSKLLDRYVFYNCRIRSTYAPWVSVWPVPTARVQYLPVTAQYANGPSSCAIYQFTWSSRHLCTRVHKAFWPLYSACHWRTLFIQHFLFIDPESEGNRFD